MHIRGEKLIIIVSLVLLVWMEIFCWCVCEHGNLVIELALICSNNKYVANMDVTMYFVNIGSKNKLKKSEIEDKLGLYSFYPTAVHNLSN